MTSAFAGLSRQQIRQGSREFGYARKSLAEERKAIRDYTRRLKRTRDPKLRKVIAHALKEEREHAASFERWLKNR